STPNQEEGWIKIRLCRAAEPGNSDCYLPDDRERDGPVEGARGCRVSVQSPACDGVALAVKDLSTAFEPSWAETEKLAWLVFTNLASMPAQQKRLALDVAQEAVEAEISASAASRQS